MRKPSLLAVLVVAVLGGLTAVGSAYATPEPGATNALTAAVTARVPSPTELFVNCPSENPIQFSDGSTGIDCEFRVVARGLVYDGFGEVRPTNGSWQVTIFDISRPAPNKTRTCHGHITHARSQVPRKLKSHGIPCGEARFLAYEVSNNPDFGRHFTQATYPTHSIGFVLQTFACTGREKVRHTGGGGFLIFIKDNCVNSFGDRFIYRWIQVD